MRDRTTRRALLLGGLVLIVLIVSACTGSRRATAYQYHWNIFFDSLFRPDPRIIHGVILTVAIAVISQIIGVILGVMGALGSLSRHRAVRWIANTYVWIFRGTPLLVQLVFIYYGLQNTNLLRWQDISINGFVIPTSSRPASLPWA